MVDTSVRKLAEYISDIKYEQEQVKSNISPNDPNGFDQRAIITNFACEGTLVITKKEYAGCFIVGHSVYGEVGPSTYPVSVPLILDHPVYGYLDDTYISDDFTYLSEVLYTKEF